MKRFDAISFQDMIMVIKQVSENCERAARVSGKAQEKAWPTIKPLLDNLMGRCQDIGLRFSEKHIRAMRQDIENDLIKLEQMKPFFEELLTRIADEIEDKFFFDIGAEKINYYEKPREIFGQGIIDKFPSIALEVEESGKCYAVGRHTACAFHLMRIMEVGVRTLGKSLNLSVEPARNPTWEAILKKCDDELKKPLKERSAEWKSDEVFFSEATANLRAVKDAWRNPTMHVEHIYDEEKALDVFNSVRAFMRHLATKLAEPKPHA